MLLAFEFYLNHSQLQVSNQYCLSSYKISYNFSSTTRDCVFQTLYSPPFLVCVIFWHVIPTSLFIFNDLSFLILHEP